MTTQPAIRDLIYLDLEKAASIYSQIAGGLTRETQQLLDSVATSRTEVDLGVGFARAGLVDADTERTARLETKVLHHDLLARIEEVLFSNGAAVDINGPPAPETASAVRETLEDAGYIRATGRVILEDYEQLKTITEHFSELLAVIARSAAGDAIADDQRIAQLQSQLERRPSTWRWRATRKPRRLHELSKRSTRFAPGCSHTQVRRNRQPGS